MSRCTERLWTADDLGQEGKRGVLLMRIDQTFAESLPKPTPGYRNWREATLSLAGLVLWYLAMLGLGWYSIDVSSPSAIEKRKEQERTKALIIQLEKDARAGKTGEGLRILFGVDKPRSAQRKEESSDRPALKDDSRHPASRP
jgi:hypothetical protein